MTGAQFSPALPDLDTLSLEQQVAQMFVVRASGRFFDRQIEFPDWEPPAATLEHWLHDLGVGGVILVGGSAVDLLVRSRWLQARAQYPLFVAADIEEGVGQRFAGATWFPPPMAIAAIADRDPDKARHYAEAYGATTAREALAIGINWVLGPVVDVNNNPQNPVINVRAFGETPERVADLATAFLRGVQRFPALSCAKHFPGHGDTSVDSHVDLPVLTHSAERLAQLEQPPFARAIAAGVDAVMSAHLLIPSWDGDRPATLSSKILTDRLRGDLGFDGLILTDALVMGAIANRYGANEAPLLALEAGADILLMPVDPAGAIRTICDAVDRGRVSPERIRQSVERIWRAKHKIFAEPANLPPASETTGEALARLQSLAAPDAGTIATEILQESQQVGGSLPLSLPPSNAGATRNVLLVDNLVTCGFLGRQAPAIAIPQARGYTLQLVDLHTDSDPQGDPPPGSPCEPSTQGATLLQVFIRGNPFGGPARATELADRWLKHLLTSGQLQGVAIYGSPYVLQQFLPQLPADLPYVFSYGQMHEAQAIALDALFGVGDPVVSKS